MSEFLAYTNKPKPVIKPVRNLRQPTIEYEPETQNEEGMMVAAIHIQKFKREQREQKFTKRNSVISAEENPL